MFAMGKALELPFAAFMASYETSPRAQYVIELVEDAQEKYGFHFEYFLARYVDPPGSKYRRGRAMTQKWVDSIRPPGGIHEVYMSLTMFGLESILNGTDERVRWFMKCDDDDVVDWKKLPEVLAELESMGDPLTEFIAMANCLRYEDSVIAQGGSGEIMSRALTVEMRDHAWEFFWNATHDDWATGEMWRTLGRSRGWTPKNWTSPRFSGHDGGCDRNADGNGNGIRNLRAVFDRDWRALPRCPVSGEAITCRWFVEPVRNIFSWHPCKEGALMKEFASWFFDQPPQVKWWLNGEFYPAICWDGTDAEGEAWRAAPVFRPA
jgi:hypothetical protein